MTKFATFATSIMNNHVFIISLNRLDWTISFRVTMKRTDVTNDLSHFAIKLIVAFLAAYTTCSECLLNIFRTMPHIMPSFVALLASYGSVNLIAVSVG